MSSLVRSLIRLAALALGVVVASAQVPEPEVFSPVGKAFHARTDDKREVAAADLALARGPASPELLLAAAHARDLILRFSESIPLYTQGMDSYPGDVRFIRFRGHRFISTRRFQLAIVDLKKAAELAPASFDVSYHLGLAYYLHGDFNHAAREYQRCLAMATLPVPDYMKGMPAGWASCYRLDDKARISLIDWAWRALRRAGKPDEASKVLAAAGPVSSLESGGTHARALLLWQGNRTEAETTAGALTGHGAATVGYAVGLWHFLAGRRKEACASWEKTIRTSGWAAFGFIAAEAEIARGGCKAGEPAKKR